MGEYSLARHDVDKPTAAWRLYELNLRYPDANFSTEVLFFDMERDFAIVKARLYLGPDYDVSHKKAEALKQGKLSQLDKLNTAAKVRCARDMGIGTEYALEFNEDDEMPPAGQASQAEALATIKAEVKTLG